MKGKVLGYNAAEGFGAITADDGSRHKFTAADWRGEKSPTAGMTVDFESADGAAKEIYPLGGGALTALGNVNVGGAPSSLKAGQGVEMFKRSLAAPLALAALVACFLSSLAGPAGQYSLIGLGGLKEVFAATSALTGEGDAGMLNLLFLLRFAAPLAALWLLWTAWRGGSERLALFVGAAGALAAVGVVFLIRELALGDIPSALRGIVGAAFSFGLGFWLLLLTGAGMIAAGVGVIRNPLSNR